MQRPSHRFQATLQALSIGFVALACAVPGHADAQDRPNVLVIISDDAGWADFGFQGSIKVPTPHLDALATRGVIFSNAYAGSVCSPSRAMLTTGMYTGRIGYNNNIGSDGYNNRPITDVPIVQGLPLSAVTIWERMQSVGYATACIGKWHIGGHVNGQRDGQTILGNRPQNQGVEHFAGLIGGSRSYWVGGAGGTQALQMIISDGQGRVDTDQIIESRYDGQYVTDTLGTLTIDYIRDHHDPDQPFFLYSSFTAPHTPMHATDDDLAATRALGHDFSANREIQVAMQRALDRNVGRIMAAIDDPNGDGDTADSIRDNTLIIFVNDNGGDSADSTPNYSSNWPLRDGKGSQWEGGIRVPMIVAGAGVDPAMRDDDVDVFEDPVHVIDILPTAFAAGGGNFTDDDVIDGANLLPFINGTTEGPPHETLYLRRYSGGKHAVRMGDYKLLYSPALGFVLFDLTQDPGERNNIADQHSELVEQMQRIMTDYDVQMDKPRFDNLAMRTNPFDDLRYREGAAAQGLWSAQNMWVDADASTQGTMTMYDSFAGATLVFRNRNGTDYTATNDLQRAGGLDFIANQVRFVGRSEPLTGNGTARIDGLPLLLTNNLAGRSPQLALSATLAGPNVYTYDLALDVNLYDDLVVTGSGNQRFVMSGDLLEYRPGRSLTKAGTSTLTITGASHLTGEIRVREGQLVSNNRQSLGDADLWVGPHGVLSASHTIELDAGQRLAGAGDINADVACAGTLQADADATLNIIGSLSLDTTSTLIARLAVQSPVQFDVADEAHLRGALVIDPADRQVGRGDRITLVRAASITGAFDTVRGLDLGDGQQLVLDYTDAGVSLIVRQTGDMDGDGSVTQSDIDSLLARWGGTVPAGSAGDWDADGRVTQQDLAEALAHWSADMRPRITCP